MECVETVFDPGEEGFVVVPEVDYSGTGCADLSNVYIISGISIEGRQGGIHVDFV